MPAPASADSIAPFGEGTGVLRKSLQCRLESDKLGPVPRRSLLRQLASLQRLQLLMRELDLTTPTAVTPMSQILRQKNETTVQGRQHRGRFSRNMCKSKRALGIANCCLKMCKLRIWSIDVQCRCTNRAAKELTCHVARYESWCVRISSLHRSGSFK